MRKNMLGEHSFDRGAKYEKPWFTGMWMYSL